ncbi:vesicular inhibitory amino acid transporter [Sarcoptes scabiei]|nr:vesicular inhibitory amino acid transporter [Sarcoptes scabiei]
MISSDTFVVMPSATLDNQMIFAKNSGRPAGEVQEIVFFGRRKFDSETKQKCTHIEIDSVPQTFSIILSKPSWMWGAEMGSNENNVCIGNELIKPNSMIEIDNTDQKLTGNDLVRLGLERSKTASEAVDVIGQLLKTYGQGVSDTNDDRTQFLYQNSFLIADPNEAWIMETIDKEFVAKRINSECFYGNISNCYSIGTDIDRMSKDIKTYAIEKNLWNGNGEFNFANIFGDSEREDRSRLEAGKILLNNLTKNNSFDIKSMLSVLRDYESGICRGCSDPIPTASSQISILAADDLKQIPSVHWFTGTPDPQYSYFKPFIFHRAVSVASAKTIVPKNSDGQSLDDGKHQLFKRHEEFYDRLRSDHELHQTLRQIENLCIDELRQMFNTNDSNDEINEIDNLFSDSVESELRFYR